MGEPRAQLIHQLNSEFVALIPDMGMQGKGQDGAGDILEFLFEVAIALTG
jgi:hypothetical protein